MAEVSSLLSGPLALLPFPLSAFSFSRVFLLILFTQPSGEA